MNKNEIIKKFREYKTSSDDDVIRWKELIKEKLLSNEYILFALNSEDEKAPDDYFGTEIRDSLVIPEIQTRPTHFLTYQVGFSNISLKNESRKYGEVIFNIFCSNADNRENYSGLNRHDLIGSLIRETFTWSNVFGNQCKLESNKETTLDSNYARRTLVFSVNTLKDTNINNEFIKSEIRR
jgi:hypothetical protein